MSTKTHYLRAHVPLNRFNRARKILQKLGMEPAEAVNVFFARIEEDKDFPFDIRKSESRELLSTPAFLDHLKRMQAGEVQYTDAKDVPA